VLYLASGGLEQLVTVSTTPTLDPAELIVYEGEKLADGWSAVDVTRHISVMRPYVPYLHVLGDQACIRLHRDILPDTNDVKDWTDMQVHPQNDIGMRYLTGAIITKMQTAGVDWSTLTAALAQQFFEEAFLALTGTPVTLTPSTSADYALPMFACVTFQNFGAGITAHFIFPKDDREMTQASLFYFYNLSSAIVQDPSGPLMGGQRLASRPTLNDYSLMRSADTVSALGAINAGAGVTVALMKSVTLQANVTRIISWINQFLPDYDLIDAYVADYASNPSVPSFSGLQWRMPGLYFWGIHQAFDELAIWPSESVPGIFDAQVPLSLLEVSGARASAVYRVAPVNTAVRLSYDKLIESIDQLITDSIDGSDNQLSLIQLRADIASSAGKILCSGISNQQLIPPTSPLTGTRLYGDCLTAGYDILNEVLVPATASDPALTFGQANNRVGGTGPTFIHTAMVTDHGFTPNLLNADTGSSVEFTVTATGDPGSEFYYVTAVYTPGGVNLFTGLDPITVATAEQAKWYVMTGAEYTVVHTLPGPLSDTALETYLSGPVSDLVTGEVRGEDHMRIDDEYFLTTMGPKPNLFDDDKALRAWFITKGVNRRELEKLLVSMLTMGQTYPQITV
jgi:hypothetical protein